MSSARAADRALTWSLGLVAAVTGGIVLLILAFLAAESAGALGSVGPLRFLTDDGWLPSRGAEGRFGLMPMLVATGLVAFGAVVLATPAGVAVAVVCRFLAPEPAGRWLHRLVEVLAGVPSVVFGFWGLVTLVPLVQRIEPPGQSVLAGALVLALMVLPTIALMAEAALRAVPAAQLTGAVALGLDRWSTVRRIALPAAAPGIASGVLLATVRALGETMAVLMVCGNVVQVPTSVFDPVRTLTANIALEMAYATAHHRSALFTSGLALIVVVAAALVVIERLDRRGAARWEETGG